jgi:hypothetical protein
MLLKFFKEALSLRTSDVMKHIDKIEKTQAEIKKDVTHLKERIDPLAELVESMREGRLRE